MKVILFGATGMIGQAVMRECLLDPDVRSVLSVTRRATDKTDPKLREIIHGDFTDFSSIANELVGYDACLFCLGVSSAGMSETEYTRVTYDVAVAAGKMLLANNPRLTFVFVSGMGTDSSETGKSMWARVKGRTENTLLSMPFKASYMVRPAVVQPLHGERSRATLSRAGYVVMAPFLSLLKAVAPKYVTTSERIGRAMILLAKHGAPKRILESADIDALGRDAALEPS